MKVEFCRKSEGWQRLLADHRLQCGDGELTTRNALRSVAIMPSRGFCPYFLAALLLLANALRAAGDPIAELAKFSVFGSVDPARLANGKITSARGPQLDFPRDLSVQAVYLVPAPLAKTVELHKQFDATRHPELKVYLHGDISPKPLPADFARLNSSPANGAGRALFAATQKLPGKSDLQLSSAEARSGAGVPANAFWSRLLLQRAGAFATGGLGAQPPYEVDGQSARVSEEVGRLLKEQPKVRTQFQPLIGQTPLGGGAGSLPASHYWELFDVDGTGALSLGASYTAINGDTAQMADLQYYASGGYFVFLTLYQMWDITIDGHPATLVWRGDSLSSLSLSELHGMERMGSGAAMMKEVQRTIGSLQKDLGR